MNVLKLHRVVGFLLMLLPILAFSQSGKKVYLVLGSDTAIWDGMNTARYNCTYNPALYIDPGMNAFAVMDSSWRNRFRDENGTPMKLTWWMMAGSIFRYATNTDVPVPNIMTMYLMKKYHGEAIDHFGDELTLHYHTFTWTDYDGDGTYWWNQAKNFSECRDDFDVTVSQFLLEEEVFPISFRSGWHAMDNTWQQYLDQILPYSLHNDWPNKRTETAEPIDNVFDWSLSPQEFVPFRPSTTDYRVPGDGKGWNVRSIHIGRVDSSLMEYIFSSADQGTDQVACLWGHLPETDFLTNLEKIDAIAHQITQRYPDVTFEYSTAVEAMQKWRQSADTTAPVVILQENLAGDNVTFTITSDEPIFQEYPFVAVKDLYERYVVLPCSQTGPLQWTTDSAVTRSMIAKMGYALTDTMGNQTLEVVRYLPDDLFVDDQSGEYQEVSGTWSSAETAAWGPTARKAVVAPGDSVVVRWTLPVSDQRLYNVFAQIPDEGTRISNSTFVMYKNGLPSDTATFDQPLPGNQWIYLFTVDIGPGDLPAVELVSLNTSSGDQTALADVLRCTPLVRDRHLVLDADVVDFGYVSIDDTATVELGLTNLGILPLTLSSVTTDNSSLVVEAQFPVVVPSMTHVTIPFRFHSPATGTVSDQFILESDDPVTPARTVQFTASVLMPFRIVDNEDSVSYEEAGTWYTSVAQAYGPSSRYAWVSDGASVSARFRTTLSRNGIYDIQEIVPTTVNSSDAALYIVSVDGLPVDSVIVDQNAGSGDWVFVGRYRFPAGVPIDVTVTNSGLNTGGPVLRADAIKFQLLRETTAVNDDLASDTPKSFELSQNYPNPFNPTTTIRFALPRETHVLLTVYDNLGREVLKSIDERRSAGVYSVTLDAGNLVSGVYFYRLTAGEYVQTKKMILLR